MKLGFFGARANNAGLGSQSWEFWRHVRPEATALIDYSHIDGKESFPERFAGDPGVTHFHGPPTNQEIEGWLDLEQPDAVVCMETPYNFHLYTACKARKITTFNQYNFEFLRYFQAPELPIPDVLIAPTTWCLDRVQAYLGRRCWVRHLPVPTATDRFPDLPTTRVRRFLHVSGYQLHADRNGTEALLRAIPLVENQDVRFTIFSQRHLPGIADERVTVINSNLLHYWDLYQHGDCLLLPRRYGGLCLVEGTLVTLEDGSRKRIEDVCVGESLRDIHGQTIVTAKASRKVEETIRVTVRGATLESSVDHLHMVAETPNSALVEKRADQIAIGDWMLLTRPDAEGIHTVDVGPKPVRKGLRRWWPTVTLDEGWARLIGLWLAEGHGGVYTRGNTTRERNTLTEVKWSFGGGEEHFADEVVRLLAERGIPASKKFADSQNCTFGRSQTWLVRCRSLWLWTMFEKLGLGSLSHGKRAPDVAFDLVPALVGGWLDGDGNDYGGIISGYSRSTSMISDFWRLLAKRGILASVSHGGERLDISCIEDAQTVAGWCQRLKCSRERNREARGTRCFHDHESGWLVAIKSVERITDASNVVAIETSTGQYIANDILTHNCLPMQEGFAAGRPVVMPETPPNIGLCHPRCLFPVRGTDESGDYPLAIIDPGILAAQIDRVAGWSPAEVAEVVAYQRARVHPWSEWGSHYREFFASHLG